MPTRFPRKNYPSTNIDPDSLARHVSGSDPHAGVYMKKNDPVLGTKHTSLFKNYQEFRATPRTTEYGYNPALVVYIGQTITDPITSKKYDSYHTYIYNGETMVINGVAYPVWQDIVSGSEMTEAAVKALIRVHATDTDPDIPEPHPTLAKKVHTHSVSQITNLAQDIVPIINGIYAYSCSTSAALESKEALPGALCIYTGEDTESYKAGHMYLFNSQTQAWHDITASGNAYTKAEINALVDQHNLNAGPFSHNSLPYAQQQHSHDFASDEIRNKPTISNSEITITRDGSVKGSFRLNQTNTSSIDVGDSSGVFTIYVGPDRGNGAPIYDKTDTSKIVAIGYSTLADAVTYMSKISMSPSKSWTVYLDRENNGQQLVHELVDISNLKLEFNQTPSDDSTYQSIIAVPELVDEVTIADSQVTLNGIGIKAIVPSGASSSTYTTKTLRFSNCRVDMDGIDLIKDSVNVKQYVVSFEDGSVVDIENVSVENLNTNGSRAILSKNSTLRIKNSKLTYVTVNITDSSLLEMDTCSLYGYSQLGSAVSVINSSSAIIKNTYFDCRGGSNIKVAANSYCNVYTQGIPNGSGGYIYPEIQMDGVNPIPGDYSLMWGSSTSCHVTGNSTADIDNVYYHTTSSYRAIYACKDETSVIDINQTGYINKNTLCDVTADHVLCVDEDYDRTVELEEAINDKGDQYIHKFSTLSDALDYIRMSERIKRRDDKFVPKDEKKEWFILLTNYQDSNHKHEFTHTSSFDEDDIIKDVKVTIRPDYDDYPMYLYGGGARFENCDVTFVNTVFTTSDSDTKLPIIEIRGGTLKLYGCTIEDIASDEDADVGTSYFVYANSNAKVIVDEVARHEYPTVSVTASYLVNRPLLEDDTFSVFKIVDSELRFAKGEVVGEDFEEMSKIGCDSSRTGLGKVTAIDMENSKLVIDRAEEGYEDGSWDWLIQNVYRAIETHNSKVIINGLGLSGITSDIAISLKNLSKAIIENVKAEGLSESTYIVKATVLTQVAIRNITAGSAHVCSPDAGTMGNDNSYIYEGPIIHMI